MGVVIRFSGPDGPYDLLADDSHDFVEDSSFLVNHNGRATRWHIERAETDENGLPVVSGMTADGTGLWFVLTLGLSPRIEYWGNSVLIRADQSV